MRVSAIVAALATLAAVASARSIGRRQDEVPQCALTCADSAKSDSCGDMDVACLCKDPKVTESVEQCVKSTCKPEELDAAIKAACALCSNAGVTLPETMCKDTPA